MADNFYRDVTRILRAHGWSFKRAGNGSHEIWQGPDARRVTVPRKLKRRATTNDILKQAKTGEKI